MLNNTERKTLVLGATGRIGNVLQVFWKDQPTLWAGRKSIAQDNWFCIDPIQDPSSLVSAAQTSGTILCLAGAVPGRNNDLSLNWALAKAAIIAAAKSSACRVLLCSSAAIYGDATGLLCEDSRPTPQNPYGVSKYEMEQNAQTLAAELAVEVTSLRIGNVAGLDSVFGGWKPGFQLDHFSDGTSPKRSYIGVETLASVLSNLVQAPNLPDVINIAQPSAISFAELLKAGKLEFTKREAPATAIREVVLDVNRLKSLLAPAFELPYASAKGLVAEWSRYQDMIAAETHR